MTQINPLSNLSKLTAKIDPAYSLEALSAQRDLLTQQITRLAHDHRQLSAQIEAELNLLARLATPVQDADFILEPLTPVAEPDSELTTGGRPLSGVISTAWWLKIMESTQGAYEAGLYYDRTDGAMRFIRMGAVQGLLPRSKSRLPLYRMLIDGQSHAEIAAVLGRDIGWVRHHAHYLQALIIRRNAGLDVPDIGVPLPQFAAD